MALQPAKASQPAGIPPAVVPAGTPRANATPDEREAAGRLGMVYRELAKMRALPFGKWAIAASREGINHGPFYAALGKAYGTDTDPGRRIGRDYLNRYTLYKRDYDAVMPKLRVAIEGFATIAVNAEVIQLTTLLKRLSLEQGLKERLSTKAAQILKEAGGVKATPEDYKTGETLYSGGDPAQHQAPTGAAPDKSRGNAQQEKPQGSAQQRGYPISYLSPDKLKRVTRRRIAAVVCKSDESVLKVLFAHPRGVDILNAFSISGDLGVASASLYLNEAIRTLEKFYTQMSADDHVMRYSFMVIGGVVARKLRDVPGFTEYALAIGTVLARDVRDEFLGFAALAVGCLGLLFMGLGGLAVILAVSDVAIAGGIVLSSFLREQEQDYGFEGSRFRSETEQFATDSIFADTTFAGAAAMLSVLGLFGAIRNFRAMRQLQRADTAVELAERNAIAAASKNPLDEGRGIASRLNDRAVPTQDARGIGTIEKKQPQYQASTPSDAERARLIQDERAAREARELADSKVPAQTSEGSAPARGTDKSSPAKGRATDRGLEAAQRESARERVSKREYLKKERANIDKQIRDAELVIEAEKAAKEIVRKRLESLGRQMRAAERAGDAAQYSKLKAEFDSALDELKGFAISELNLDKLGLKKLRNLTTDEYFDALSAAAAKRREYKAVKAGKLDDAYMPVGDDTWVEHVYPRSSIFQMEGFLSELTWEQQIFLFNLRKNLKLSSAEFNLLRGTKEYARLDPVLVSRYIKDEKQLKNLSALEREVEADIERLLSDPRNPKLWRDEFGYQGGFN